MDRIITFLIDLIWSPKDIIKRFSKKWFRRETGFIIWKKANTFQMILSRWSFVFVSTDLILQKFINYLNKMHPLCGSLGFGNVYCEERLRSLKDTSSLLVLLRVYSREWLQRWKRTYKRTGLLITAGKKYPGSDLSRGALACRVYWLLVLYWLLFCCRIWTQHPTAIVSIDNSHCSWTSITRSY